MSLEGRPHLRELSPTFQIRCAVGRCRPAELPLLPCSDAVRAGGPLAVSLMPQPHPRHAPTHRHRRVRSKLGPPVARRLPPLLVLHGTADHSVPMEIAVEFVAALKVGAGWLELGVSCWKLAAA